MTSFTRSTRSWRILRIECLCLTLLCLRGVCWTLAHVATSLTCVASEPNKAQVPQVFEVKWPVDDQVIRSDGIINFFRDFYAMSVQRPYRQPPGIEFIKVLVNPEYIPSTSSRLKCLIVCSSHYRVQMPLHRALLCVQKNQSARDWSSLDSWSPLHPLMDFISVIYQMMFQEMEKFVRRRLLVIQAVVGQCFPA